MYNLKDYLNFGLPLPGLWRNRPQIAFSLDTKTLSRVPKLTSDISPFQSLTNPYSGDTSIKRPTRTDTKISCIWLISNRTELTIVVLDYVLEIRTEVKMFCIYKQILMVMKGNELELWIASLTTYNCITVQSNRSLNFIRLLPAVITPLVAERRKRLEAIG